MTNNFRALCAEPLAQEAYVAFVQICKGGSDDAGTYDADEAIVRRALKRLHELESAALADEPAVLDGREPTSVADGEVAELVAWLRVSAAGNDRIGATTAAAQLNRAAELLERLSPPQPVPVSERLPEPEDCDAEGRCWWWDGEWGLVEHRFLDYCVTHWLPAHALPLPEVDE